MRVTTDSTQLNQKAWSAFVTNHPQGNIFQSPEMYEVYKRTNNYDPFIITAFSDEISGILLGVIQKENKLLGNLSSRSIIWGGPLLIPNDGSILLKLFKKYMAKINRRALYTQIRNINDVSDSQNLFDSIGFRYEDHLNYILDLSKGEDTIWHSMNKKRRNTIKKAIRLNISIVEVGNIQELEKSYQILKEVYSRARLPLADFSLFKSAYDILGPKKMVKCFNAKHNNSSIGTLWILNYKNRIYDWYSGSLHEHLDKSPNDLLIWNAIKWGIEKDYEIFDFGGAGKPGVHYGVRDFKKKFGGLEVCFGRYVKTHRPILNGFVMRAFRLKQFLGL